MAGFLKNWASICRHMDVGPSGGNTELFQLAMSRQDLQRAWDAVSLQVHHSSDLARSTSASVSTLLYLAYRHRALLTTLQLGGHVLRGRPLPLQLERCAIIVSKRYPRQLTALTASQPNCITGVMSWVHGQYSLETNGTIVLTPLGDGYQQVQDPCAAESNFVENFNYTELITRWTIDQDVDRGYRLRLWDYAGYPLPPQYLLSTTPNMLPKTRLREVAIDPDTLLTQRKRSVDLTKRGAGEHGRRELGYREENAAESWFRTALDKIFGGSSQKDE